MRRISGSALLAVCALALGSATGRGEDKKVNIEGTYVIVEFEVNGMAFPAKAPEDERTVKFTADKMIRTTKGGKEHAVNYKIDTSKTPHQIDLSGKDEDKGREEKFVGVFKIDGDKLIICTLKVEVAEDRPKAFNTAGPKKTTMMTLQKKK